MGVTGTDLAAAIVTSWIADVTETPTRSVVTIAGHKLTKVGYAQGPADYVYGTATIAFDIETSDEALRGDRKIAPGRERERERDRWGAVAAAGVRLGTPPFGWFGGLALRGKALHGKQAPCRPSVARCAAHPWCRDPPVVQGAPDALRPCRGGPRLPSGPRLLTHAKDGR